MITLDFSGIHLKLKQEEGKTYIFDPVRKKWFVLTPEEHVRQYVLGLFIENELYPKGLIAVEKQIKVGNMPKRFDITVFDREQHPWMLVECKEPEVMITKDTLHQLLNYQRVIQCRYWLLTNGHETFCADAQDPEQIKWLDTLPAYDL